MKKKMVFDEIRAHDLLNCELSGENLKAHLLLSAQIRSKQFLRPLTQPALFRNSNESL